jgi:hypothetical protein
VIDESDSQYEKHFDPRISILLPISIADNVEKFRINLRWTTSIRKFCSIAKILLPDSIEIDDKITPLNAESSMH